MSRSRSSTTSAGAEDASTVGAISRSPQRRRPPVAEQHAEDGLVVAADERRRRAHPDPAVPAADVVDQVGQRLRHRGARVPGQQPGDVAGGPAGVEGAPHGRLGEPVDRRATGRLDVGDQPQRPGQRGLERPGRDRGEVGLQQHVVQRRRQRGLERGRPRPDRRRPPAAGRARRAPRRWPGRASAPRARVQVDQLVLQPAAAPRRLPAQPGRERLGVVATPVGRAARSASTAARTAGATVRSRSGPSGDSVRPRWSRPPTRPGTRVVVSQACASASQRSATVAVQPAVVRRRRQPQLGVVAAVVPGGEQPGGVRGLDEQRQPASRRRPARRRPGTARARPPRRCAAPSAGRRTRARAAPRPAAPRRPRRPRPPGRRGRRRPARSARAGSSGSARPVHPAAAQVQRRPRGAAPRVAVSVPTSSAWASSHSTGLPALPASTSRRARSRCPVGGPQTIVASASAAPAGACASRAAEPAVVARARSAIARAVATGSPAARQPQVGRDPRQPGRAVGVQRLLGRRAEAGRVPDDLGDGARDDVARPRRRGRPGRCSCSRSRTAVGSAPEQPAYVGLGAVVGQRAQHLDHLQREPVELVERPGHRRPGGGAGRQRGEVGGHRRQQVRPGAQQRDECGVGARAQVVGQAARPGGGHPHHGTRAPRQSCRAATGRSSSSAVPGRGRRCCR